MHTWPPSIRSNRSSRQNRNEVYKKLAAEVRIVDFCALLPFSGCRRALDGCFNIKSHKPCNEDKMSDKVVRF